MKNIFNLLVGSVLILGTTGVIAADTKTSLDKNWVCSTNASSSSVAADTSADEQMENSAKSAADAFAFASQNCRDCTKITCETK